MGTFKLTLKGKLDIQFIHSFQDLDELNKIITKISDQDIRIQNSESEDVF